MTQNIQYGKQAKRHLQGVRTKRDKKDYKNYLNMNIDKRMNVLQVLFKIYNQ